MLSALRLSHARVSLKYVRCQSSGQADFELLNIRVTREFLPLAESTSVFDGAAKSSRVSVADAMKAIEERQEQRKKSGVFAIEATRCKHGFPRAYVVISPNSFDVAELTNTNLHAYICSNCPYMK